MLTEQVKKTIKEHNLLQNKQHIVLGLSGGPDSVCLFHVLMKLSRQMQTTVHPVHINHKLRPGAAERDQQYVENLCRSMGTSCSVFTVDCSALARELSVPGEEAGRIARYGAFYETAEKIAVRLVSEGMSEAEARDNVKIAVAHNAGDQAETILFRLLRGTGVDGLAGMAYERKEHGFSVIRPILDVKRADIEEYCERNGLSPVTDQTNKEAIYARNKIRLELLPLLEREYNGNIKESLLRLGRIAAEDKDYLWQQTEQMYADMAEIRYGETPDDLRTAPDNPAVDSGTALKNPAAAYAPVPEAVAMDREKLSAVHPSIRHRLIMKAFAQIGLEKDISEERIKSADAIISKKQAPKTVEFPHGYRLSVAKGKVTFFRSLNFK